jgi:hypothetical protein
MKYNPKIEPNGKNIGQKNNCCCKTTLKTKALCVRYVSLSIRQASRTSFRYIVLMYAKDKVLMYCTQWAMTVLIAG